MACGAARAAQGGEGADAARRRSGAAAPGTALGPGRQGVPVRDRRGQRLAGGPVPRALAAPRLPLHVRARLQGGVSVLLGDRGRLQRLRRSPRQPRRRADGGVAGAAGEAAGLQAADGVDVSLGVRGQRRLQLRLQRLAHRDSSSARGPTNTTTGPARRCSCAATPGPSTRSRPRPEPTWLPSCASGRA